MNNRKFYFWLGGLAVFLLLVYSFYLAFKDSKNQPAKPPDKIIIQSASSPVEVNNFLKNPKEQLSYGAVLAETGEFKIIYFSDDEGLLITLKATPLNISQGLAEAELLNQLGISKKEACKLTISITVPMDVSREASGKNYPLSFCAENENF